MDIYMLYGVTALGVLLSLFWMLFISLGKSVAGADDKSNAIVYKNLEIRTNSVVVILVASLVTAVLPLLLQFYTLINLPPTPPNDATANVTPHGVVPPNETLEGAVLAEARCKSLKGLYRLYGDYDFVRTGNIKATVRSSTWDANTCKEGKDGSYVLRGKDTARHEIELLINQRWEHIATTDIEYSSEVLIDQQGKLIKRTFQYDDPLPEPQLLKGVLKRLGLEGQTVDIKKKIKDYTQARDAKLSLWETRICQPAVFDHEARTLIAFLCHDYIRAMARNY